MQTTSPTYRTRSWDHEWMYAVVIDRFHDGKQRNTVQHEGKGFGTTEALRQTCGGTFNGIRLQLPYLKTLGCTCLLLTPFLENNPEFYHGYAIQDFTKPDARFGTLEELKQLVSDAHRLDMRVVMDVVLNHTGNNWSYKKNNSAYQKGRSFAFSHWRYEDKPQPLSLRNKTWYSKKGQIVNWDAYPETWDGDVFELKDLVWTEDKKGHQLLDTMLEIYWYWVKTLDIDAFRLDALKHIRPNMAQQFCLRMKEEARRLGKSSFMLFGEIVGDVSLISTYQGLDGYFNFPFYFEWNTHWHDDRLLDVFGFDQGHREALPINFLDNHDQIGLEPKRRIGALLSEEGMLCQLFLLGLMQGIPCLYYGTEQGLRDEGAMDHDVRSCMFDLHADVDLFNTTSNLFVKLSEVIRLTKEVKAQGLEVQKNTRVDAVQQYTWYNAEGERLYVICFSAGKDELVPVEQATLVYSLSGCLDRTELYPFQLQWYVY
jgi:glycosidase